MVGKALTDKELVAALEDLLAAWEVRRAPELAAYTEEVSVTARSRDGSTDRDLAIRAFPIASRTLLRRTIDLACLQQANEPGVVPIVLARYLSPTDQETLRLARVAFADLAGNAWFVRDPVYIDRRGFANPEKEERASRGPFSDKASLVIRALIEADAPEGTRRIAEKTGLSPGYVSKITHELERRGYLARTRMGVAVRHPGDLLKEWVFAYRKRRRPRGGSYFVSTPDADRLVGRLAQTRAAESDDYVLTLHAGAGLVDRYADFDTVDLYVRDVDVGAAIARELDGRPVDRGANLMLSVPHYRVSAFYGKRRIGGLWVASDLQLYLDLYDYPLRGREQAEHLFERRLLPVFEARGGL
jgi:DNA-binding Lrp family transcriptional regulator